VQDGAVSVTSKLHMEATKLGAAMPGAG